MTIFLKLKILYNMVLSYILNIREKIQLNHFLTNKNYRPYQILFKNKRVVRKLFLQKKLTFPNLAKVSVSQLDGELHEVPVDLQISEGHLWPLARQRFCQAATETTVTFCETKSDRKIEDYCTGLLNE